MEPSNKAPASNPGWRLQFRCRGSRPGVPRGSALVLDHVVRR